MTRIRNELVRLFEAASEAHHEAFIETDGADAHWTEWYSKYLALPLSHLLGTSLPPDVIATALPGIDMEMKTAGPASQWAGYCADWFLTRYAARVDAARTS